MIIVFAFSIKQRELMHAFTIPVGQGPLLAMTFNLTHIATASAGQMLQTRKPKEKMTTQEDHSLSDDKDDRDVSAAVPSSQSLVHLWEIGYGY